MQNRLKKKQRGKNMEIKNSKFYVLKGKKNHVFLTEDEAISQIKKDKDTTSKLISVDVIGETWHLGTVQWDEIAKHLME